MTRVRRTDGAAPGTEIGHDLRVLHLGNIANLAYNNARLLRECGVSCDVVNYDYGHVTAQPEWEDAPITGDVPETDVDWSKVDLGGYVRPDWFRDVDLSALGRDGTPGTGIDHWLHVAELARRRLGARLLARGLHRNPGEFWTISATPRHWPALLTRLPAAVALTGIAAARRWRARRQDNLAGWESAEQAHLRELVASGEVSAADVREVLPEVTRLRPVLRAYPLVQAYGLAPIAAMLAGGGRPYIALEHGTMRTFPEQPNAVGRLLQAAYRHAEAVIITNPDVIDVVHRLGLDRAVFIPHPVDERRYCPTAAPAPAPDRPRTGIRVLAPARQNWRIKGNDVAIRGFAEFLGRGGHGALVLAAWGQEVERSRRLVTALGIGHAVEWIPPLPKQRLIEEYRAADVVLDQFVIGTFGGIAPEAMSCGTPVVMHFNPSFHEWCFDERPPIRRAHTPGEVAVELERMERHPEGRAELARSARQWVERHHGHEIVIRRHMSLYERVLQEHGSCRAAPTPASRSRLGRNVSELP